MSNPIVEQIAVKLEEAINAITEANGFNYDLTAVRPKRIHLEGDLNTDRTVIIEQESAALHQRTGQTISWLQAFTLQALVIDSDTTTEAIDTRLNKIRADIEKQLTSSSYQTCGGLAEGILLKAPEKFIAEPRLSGIAVNIDVLYTTDCDDPYTQA
jgi:hypothetical protein